LFINLVNYWDKYTAMHGQHNVTIQQCVQIIEFKTLTLEVSSCFVFQNNLWVSDMLVGLFLWFDHKNIIIQGALILKRYKILHYVFTETQVYKYLQMDQLCWELYNSECGESLTGAKIEATDIEKVQCAAAWFMQDISRQCFILEFFIHKIY